MNLFSFIDKYGCYTFDEFSFTEIDNVILSMLSYLELSGIVSRNRYNPKKLSVVGEEYFKKYNKKEKKVLSIKRAIQILRDIKSTRRYGNLLLYNYLYESSEDNQFGALTIELNKKLVFVSFEGTDHLISGWKEDFMMSYMFPVLSQKRAIDYVNRNFLFRRKKIILGGHSKGGNLALVAGMYANFLVKDKIISIYNNDGPGLLEEQYNSNHYKSIESRLTHIVPNYSIFGLLLCHGSNIEVVRSFRRSIFSHDATTWVVKDNKFERSDLSLFSKKLDEEIDKWIYAYTLEERKSFVISVFNIFDKVGIHSLVDVINNKRLVLKVISETREIDEKTANMLKEFFKLIFNSFTNVTKEEISSFFEKKSSKKQEVEE